MNNFLISGGTGFIGRHLCAKLRALGHTVTILSRNPTQHQTNFEPPIRLIKQLSDYPHPKLDYVINLAGEPLNRKRWSAKQKQCLIDSRTQTTKQLTDWLSQDTRGCKAFVSASAIGYYGFHADQMLTESAQPQPGFTHQLCHEWEAAAWQAKALGLRTCALRIGIVLAANGGALFQMLPPFKLGVGGMLGQGNQWMSWIHIEDLVRIILYCCDTETLSGPINATAPHPVTNADFTQTLGDCLHRPTFLTLPEAALKLMFGEMAQLLIQGQRVIPDAVQECGFEFHYPTLGPALKQLLEN